VPGGAAGPSCAPASAGASGQSSVPTKATLIKPAGNPITVSFKKRVLNFAVLGCQPRESNDTPIEYAFCCIARSVRLSDFAIFPAGIL
jgi:hypothetical protein